MAKWTDFSDFPGKSIRRNKLARPYRRTSRSRCSSSPIASHCSFFVFLTNLYSFFTFLIRYNYWVDQVSCVFTYFISQSCASPFFGISAVYSHLHTTTFIIFAFRESFYMSVIYRNGSPFFSSLFLSYMCYTHSYRICVACTYYSSENVFWFVSVFCISGLLFSFYTLGFLFFLKRNIIILFG